MRKLKTLQIYILAELFLVFITAAAVVTSLVFLFMSLKISRSYRLHLTELVSISGYVIPTVLYFTLPIAVLIAVIFVYGRLVADNEVLAMTAGGIHIWHVVAPALLMGIIFSILMFWMNNRVIPSCKENIRNYTIQNINFVHRKLREEHEWNFGNTTILVESMSSRGSVLNGVTIRKHKKRGSGSLETTNIKAEKAMFSAGDKPGIIVVTLINGNQTISRGYEIQQYTNFERHSLQFNLDDMKERKRQEDEISTNNLRALRSRIAYDIDGSDGASPSLVLAKYSLEIGGRTASALSCLVFAILGVPLGIRGRLKNILSALLIALLPLMLVYYPFTFVGKNLAEKGRMPIWAAVWMGNILLAALGLVLFIQLLWRQRID